MVTRCRERTRLSIHLQHLFAILLPTSIIGGGRPTPYGHTKWTLLPQSTLTEMEMDIDMDMDIPSGRRTSDAAEQLIPPYNHDASEITNFIVIDTNILDHYLDVLAIFVDDVEKHRLPITVIIPKIVRQELDWQTHRKEKDSLSRAASCATRWLASSTKPSWLLREQAVNETLMPAGSSSGFVLSKAGEVNDDYILDCCQYFQSRGYEVRMWTEDNLLRWRGRHVLKRPIQVDGEIREEDLTISRPKKTSRHTWTSHAVAQALNIPTHLAASFAKTTRPVMTSSYSVALAPGETQISTMNNLMDVDHQLYIQPLDALHADVIDRVPGYLKAIVEGACPDDDKPRMGDIGYKNDPRHHPLWKRTPFSEWTPYDCIQYLTEDSASGLLKSHSWLKRKDGDHLTAFLLPTTQGVEYKGITKGKTGTHWSAADWRRALESLSTIAQMGSAYDDEDFFMFMQRLKDVIRHENLVVGISD
ncbi:unnamed protein product [Peniophora sp. CBMAI 1063]|nr:unnamed protein product [Peniophora sp. CBMAI 1063]